MRLIPSRWCFSEDRTGLNKVVEAVKTNYNERFDEVSFGGIVHFTDVRPPLKGHNTALFLSNVIDADHQNSCLFTNKGHFSLPLWV